MSENPRSHTNRSGSSRSRNCPTIRMPSSSWVSTSSRSKRRISVSRAPGCKVYRRSSSTGQQVDMGSTLDPRLAPHGVHLPAAGQRDDPVGALVAELPVHVDEVRLGGVEVGPATH